MIVADFAHLGIHLFEIPVLCISCCTSRHGNHLQPQLHLHSSQNTHTTVRLLERVNTKTNLCMAADYYSSCFPVSATDAKLRCGLHCIFK